MHYKDVRQSPKLNLARLGLFPTIITLQVNCFLLRKLVKALVNMELLQLAVDLGLCIRVAGRVHPEDPDKQVLHPLLKVADSRVVIQDFTALAVAFADPAGFFLEVVQKELRVLRALDGLAVNVDSCPELDQELVPGEPAAHREDLRDAEGQDFGQFDVIDRDVEDPLGDPDLTRKHLQVLAGLLQRQTDVRVRVAPHLDLGRAEVSDVRDFPFALDQDVDQLHFLQRFAPVGRAALHEKVLVELLDLFQVGQDLEHAELLVLLLEQLSQAQRLEQVQANASAVEPEDQAARLELSFFFNDLQELLEGVLGRQQNRDFLNVLSLTRDELDVAHEDRPRLRDRDTQVVKYLEDHLLRAAAVAGEAVAGLPCEDR